jgi:hypothetical protein
MPILAESIDGALAWIFIPPIICSGIALLSFWPSWRGHWLGLLLAAPAVYVGVTFSWFLITASRKDELMPGLWGFALWPLALGTLSAIVWLYRVPPRGDKR